MADRAVLMAGYRTRPEGKSRWQLNWVLAPDEAVAQQLYETGLLEPRRAEVQRMLTAKKAVSYEVGMVLREVGDVPQAWHLTGAASGRLQDIYFRRGRQVWLIQAGVEAHGGLSANGLQGRVEMLQTWDRPAQ
jgi:hypothetical protein